MSDFSPVPSPGPAETDSPGVESLRDVFRDAGLPTPSGALGLPTDSATVDAVMTHLGSEQPEIALASDGRTPEAVALPAPDDDAPEGDWRAKWLLGLALFPPLALVGSQRKARAEEADEERRKRSEREVGPR
jgi:hypothetical protein